MQQRPREGGGLGCSEAADGDILFHSQQALPSLLGGIGGGGKHHREASGHKHIQFREHMKGGNGTSSSWTGLQGKPELCKEGGLEGDVAGVHRHRNSWNGQLFHLQRCPVETCLYYSHLRGVGVGLALAFKVRQGSWFLFLKKKIRIEAAVRQSKLGFQAASTACLALRGIQELPENDLKAHGDILELKWSQLR